MKAKRYAVSYINFFDNILHTKIVTVDTILWRYILLAAFPDIRVFKQLKSIGIECAKDEALDRGFMFEIVKIPPEDNDNEEYPDNAHSPHSPY